MSNPVPMIIQESFRISIFNFNVLSNSGKKKDTFNFLRQTNHDIYFLQETHLKEPLESLVRASWEYNLWLAGADSNKNGVAILLKNNFEYRLYNVIRDPKGCFIILEFLKKRMSLVNLYRPSDNDSRNFLDIIKNYLDKIGNEIIILGGDWNCILSMKIDARNYASVINRPKTRARI